MDKLKAPELALLGAELFRILTAPRRLGEAWADIRAAAGGAPLHLTVKRLFSHLPGRS
ncbi:MAG: hypothetical protein IPG17_30700 [Sandaracinaceae bacterium]|nr:hypothetical protein [Sandaracinaceae bacterium]